MRAALLLLGLALHPAVMCQGFCDHSAQQSVVLNNSGLWGGGVSAYDFNSDGWPDLSFARNNEGITRFVNNNGVLELHDQINEQDLVEAEMALYADYDNDGDADLFVANDSGGSKLYKNIDGELVDVTAQANLIEDPLAWTQGACWGDYNRDGYLDLYVCNYNWNVGIDNWLYQNNGDGTFTEVAQELGVSNGSQPSFQAVFMDYNNDLWPDIFVINDRTPTNAMYRNNGDGTFTDVSVTIGLAQSMDAMTATVADYDNDGDQDIYVTNGPNGNILMENFDSAFQNTAGGTSLEVNRLCWGATWIDFNNNGYQDLYVCTEWPLGENPNPFFKNGQAGLNLVQSTFDGNNDFSAHSSAKADFNRDGKLDLVVHGDEEDHCRLFFNQSQAGNSVQVQLEGIASNKEGIGSWITSSINGETTSFYTMSGGGYMAQNSQYLNIGIGDHQSIDEIEIQWPSGQIDHFYDIYPGELITLTEGSSESYNVIFETTTFCEGDSLLLQTSDGNNPMWSNGAEGNSIWVSQAGFYNYSSLNQFNIPVWSNTIEISTAPNLVSSLNAIHPTCTEASDGSIACDIEPSPAGFEWSSGHLEEDPTGLESGQYTITYWNQIGCTFSDSIALAAPEALQAEVSLSHLECFGDSNGTAEVFSSGGTGEITMNSFGDDLDALAAGEYSIVLNDENGCELQMDFAIEGPDEITVDPILTNVIGDELGSIVLNTQGGIEPYLYYWSNGSQEADLNEINAGTYFITIEDQNGCTYYDQFTLDQFVHVESNAVEDLFFAPNPANNSVQLALKNDVYQLKLFGNNGQLIEETQIKGNHSFSTENLTNGWYILYLYNSTAVYQTKMMVQH